MKKDRLAPITQQMMTNKLIKNTKILQNLTICVYKKVKIKY